jgi:hypothetical protein
MLYSAELFAEVKAASAPPNLGNTANPPRQLR